jgi:hypothetical protein
LVNKENEPKVSTEEKKDQDGYWLTTKIPHEPTKTKYKVPLQKDSLVTHGTKA